MEKASRQLTRPLCLGRAGDAARCVYGTPCGLAGQREAPGLELVAGGKPGTSTRSSFPSLGGEPGGRCGRAGLRAGPGCSGGDPSWSVALGLLPHSLAPGGRASCPGQDGLAAGRAEGPVS